MKRSKAAQGRGWLCLALALLLALALPVAVLAEEQPGRVLRVPFSPVDGFMETQKDGSRTGLVVDYLNEIAKYTGWTYEYIDVSGEEATNAFLQGEFDLMGGTYYAPGFEKYFAYPDYTCGYTKSVLLGRQADQSFNTYDLRLLNGKTIGVYERAEENIRRLQVFLESNGLDCELRYYGPDALSEDGDLYRHLSAGEVDLLLENASADAEEFRVVATFDSQPHYIVAQPGDEKTLAELNMALQNILEANPNFAAECYEKHFSSKRDTTIPLTEAEKAYVQDRGAVRVAVTQSWHPLFCENSSEDAHNGILPDTLEQISAFTGLQFTYVYAADYAGAVRMVQQGEADLLGFFFNEEEIAAQNGLARTQTYVTLNSIVVRNKGTSYPADDLVGAVVMGRKMPTSVQAAVVQEYETVPEALWAVDRGEVDFVYGLAASLEQVIQQQHFSNVVPVTLVNDQAEIAFAMPRMVDTALLTILNKAINSISSDAANEIVERNMVSIGNNSLSLSELIYANPVLFIAVVAVFLLLVVAVVVLTAYLRVRAARMKSELARAEAESKAKGEFLSRMSHEIRTPMNAVVGLTDLTSMLKDVPEPVQANLTKIRASSRYLLSLINDILDMSQIESGMMTIAAEPFSLERMLNELQSMMEAEAKRHGLAFQLQSAVEHHAVTGDVIRLRQVLTNLLSNAFKFTPDGGCVQLRVLETGCGDAGCTFEFHVTDNGVGISEQDKERIFGAFEQVGSNSSKSQGTGLGLAISRNIVHLMGGELKLDSEKNQGSDFYFSVTLPLGQLPAEEETLKADDLLTGMRLLVAEDNDLNAEIALELLEMQGALPQRAENGKLAVECFAASAPGSIDAILMDIQMPEMNGLEAARAIRALDRPDAATVPIIAMTANSFKEDTDAAAEAGMTGFVTKPLDVNYLYSVLRGAVKQK